MGQEKKIPEYTGNGFDHRVEIRDPSTGEILAHQPYKMTVTQSSRGMVRIYERAGKKFWEDGSEASEEELKSVIGAEHSIFKKTDTLGNVLQKKTDKSVG